MLRLKVMISGKGFSEHCKWVFDTRYPDRASFDYSRAVSGDWIFVNGDYLYDFLTRIPFFTDKRFTFVVHNSDQPFDETKLHRMLRFANHIYAINTTVRHPKLTTIPIGFVDRQIPFLSSFVRPNCQRDIEIYMNFTIGTNTPKRNECVTKLQDDSRVVMRTNLSLPDYYADLCRSKFVVCPEGTGIDTHRVYEALFCGATPVVLRNSLSHLYETLPICIVDKWTDSFYIPPQRDIQWNYQLFLT